MNDHRICFVGDSLVQGTGDNACLGWPGRVSADARKKGVNVTPYNLGIRRDTSRDIGARWLREVERRLPHIAERYVVFSFGVNDVSMVGGELRVSRQDSLAAFSHIVGTAVREYHTLFIGPPPVLQDDRNERISSLSEAFAVEAEKIGVPYLPLFPSLIDDPVYMKELEKDGSHPADGGYARIAELVVDWQRWWF